MRQKVIFIGTLLTIAVILIGAVRYVFGIEYVATTALASTKTNREAFTKTTTANKVAIQEVADDVEAIKDTLRLTSVINDAEFTAIKITVSQNNSILRQMASKQGIIIP